MHRTRLLVALALAALPVAASAQEARFTHADTLRGGIGPARAWWDVVHYDLQLRVSPADSTVGGSNTIHYRTTGEGREIQVDLAAGLVLDSVTEGTTRLSVRRDGNAAFATLPTAHAPESLGSVTVHWQGRPRVARNAPWDGGLVWAKDPEGRPWVGTAVQGLGASAFWPNKDHQADEPDSMRIRVTVPSTMVEVSNGRLAGKVDNGDGTTTYDWRVTSPINNYGVTINAGSYVHFGERYAGEAGPLDLDYWVLESHLPQARRQFEQVKTTIQCFEGWFGPYPFYADGFKLIESPYLGMEHQSAVAYGNGFRNGYLGTDLSGTGLGLDFDYIIVHEAAHEWWGNNITTKDIADMWVHEGFGMYAEGLYVECTKDKDAGGRYLAGVRKNIANDGPVIGTYGVNREGSGDMYYKGANLLHTIRQLVDDDALWRTKLRGLNETFRHRTVTTAEIEAYLSRGLRAPLDKVFDQYLRHAAIPTLEYVVDGGTLRYRWRADVAGFDMPVKVTLAPGRFEWIQPVAGAWKTVPVQVGARDFRVDPGFYVDADEVGR